MEVKNTNNSIKKKIIKVIILVVVLLASIFFLILGFKPKSENKIDISHINNITNQIDYKVFLNKNSFIELDYLNKNESYISDLVKNIETIFKYNFNSSKNFDNIKYVYSIVGSIQGDYRENSEGVFDKIWYKDYILLEEKEINIQNVNGYNIEETLNLDYNFFNNQVSEFRKNLKLPLSAILTVKFNIKTYLDSEEKFIEDSMNISMPLNTVVFKINEEYKTHNDQNEIVKQYDINIVYLIISLCLILTDLGLIFFAKSFKSIFIKNTKSYYLKTLHKILKDYSDLIIETSNKIDTKEKNIIDIKNFNEMIELEEMLKNPILFYEEIKDKEAWFIILQDDTVYRFILKNNEE